MKKQYFYILIWVLLTGCLHKTSKEYFAEAENLEQQQRYKEAITQLDKAIVKDDKYLGAYINRGADKSALGDYNGAIADYKRVIKLDPENTLAYFNIGNNLKRLGDYRLAIDYYAKAFHTKGGEPLSIDINPNNALGLGAYDVLGHEISFERGLAYYEIDSLQKALSDFQNCISKNYLVAESNFWIGSIFIKSGSTEKGCFFYRKAQELGFKEAETSIKNYCQEP